jgi:diguanylate cyclase (GGDEF)-like protein/PAS domain S-box-containing protein
VGRDRYAALRKELVSGIPSLFPLLFDQLADSVYIMDLEGLIQYANPAFELLTGYSQTEVIGRSDTFLESGAHPDAIYAEMWDTIRSGTPFRFVFTNRKKNGEVYEEGVMVSPISGTEGYTTHFLHMGRLIKVTRQTYDVFTLLANSAPAGIYLQRDGVLFFVNNQLASLLGYQPNELVGKQWLQFIFEDDREDVLRNLLTIVDNEPRPAFECRIHTKNGDIRWIMASAQPITLHGTAAVSGDFFVGYVVDITDRKHAEDRLQNALSMYAATIESTTDGIIVVTVSGHELSRNHRFSQIWKLDTNAVPHLDKAGVRAAMQSQMKDPAQFLSMVDATHEDPEHECTGSVDLVDGRHLEVYTKPQMIDGAVVARVWSWRDVTERRRFEAALIRLANYDSLTGLMNRRKIQEELDRCLAGDNDACGALLLLDLDSFKEINDTFGHQAGDEVLVQVAHALKDADVGQFIGRFGGDEFAILLPDVTPAQAMQAAERTLHRLESGIYVAAGARISLTGSMGLALYPTHANTSDELLSAADLSLYEAKSGSRTNLYVYSPRLKHRSRLQSRGDWQMTLRNAISDGRGKLYVEKTIPLQDEGPDIYRLTLRLTGSRSQVLSSRELGALARQASLSQELDRWLLQEAIALAQRPTFRSAEAGLAFDLSPQSLAHPDILRQLMNLAAQRATMNRPLIIELTNLDSIAGYHSAISTLSAAGYRFKVPEGSSETLARTMQSIPIDYLKLEGPVLLKVVENPAVRALIEGVIHTGRCLGAYVLAEGVPDEATLDALRVLGVDYARGTPVDRARSASAVFKASVRKPRAA